MGEAQPTPADREAADELVAKHVETLAPTERESWRAEATAFRTVYGDHAFLVCCGVREPTTRYDRSILAFQNSDGSDQVDREISRIESERPLDLVMIEEVYQAYLDKLEPYGVLASAATQLGRMPRHRDEFDVEEVRAALEALVAPLPLITDHIDKVIDFAAEVRIDKQLGLAYFGTGHGASAIWLVAEEMEFACNDWRESRAMHESGEGAAWFGRDLSVERLYLERMAGSFCNDQLATVELEQELIACRQVLRARERTTLTEQTAVAGPCPIQAGGNECRPIAETKPRPQEPEPLPDNVFRRCGGVWQVRFQGGSPFTVLPWVGAGYIHTLLEAPNRSRSAIEIVCRNAVVSYDQAMSDKVAVDEGLQTASDPILASPGDVSDWTAIRAYRERYEELLVDIEKARRDNDNVRERQCENDLAIIIGQINKAIGIGGKLKQSKDARKNVRDSLRKNVKKVIDDQIRGTDPALAAHLDRAIEFGNEPRYVSEVGVIWETRPVIND